MDENPKLKQDRMAPTVAFVTLLVSVYAFVPVADYVHVRKKRNQDMDISYSSCCFPTCHKQIYFLWQCLQFFFLCNDSCLETV